MRIIIFIVMFILFSQNYLFSFFPIKPTKIKKFQTIKVMIEKGKFAQARSLLQKLPEKLKKNDYYLVLKAKLNYQEGKFDKAVVIIKKIPEKKRTAKVWDMLGFSYLNMANFDYQKAKYCFKQALKKQPKDYFACIGLGEIFRRNEKLRYAVKMFKRALNINPSLGEAYYCLAKSYFSLQAYDEEIKLLRNYLDNYNNRDAEALLYLGEALAKKGMLDDALQTLKEAIKINPNIGKYYAKLANILLDNQHDFSARPYLKEGLKVDPNSSELHVANGRYWEVQMQLKKALQEYKTAVALDPNNEMAYFRLANLLSGAGNINKIRKKNNKTKYKQVENIYKAYENYEMVLNINQNFPYKSQVELWLSKLEDRINQIKEDTQNLWDSYEAYRKKMEKAPPGFY